MHMHCTRQQLRKQRFQPSLSFRSQNIYACTEFSSRLSWRASRKSGWVSSLWRFISVCQPTVSLPLFIFESLSFFLSQWRSLVLSFPFSLSLSACIRDSEYTVYVYVGVCEYMCIQEYKSASKYARHVQHRHPHSLFITYVSIYV